MILRTFVWKISRRNFSNDMTNITKIRFIAIRVDNNLFRPWDSNKLVFENFCIKSFTTQLFTRLCKHFESLFYRNKRSLQSIVGLGAVSYTHLTLPTIYSV